MILPWLEDLGGTFPNPTAALKEPNGLLCAGGDLEPDTLISAYSQGIFPWFDEDQPILWWSPDPRMIIELSEFSISRSLRKFINKRRLRVTIDSAFDTVIRACAAPRDELGGTWITEDMIEAYCRLNALGFAHSVEVWDDQTLVGGLYGVALGPNFFGESMFSKVSNASKVALATLATQLIRWGFSLIDCQVSNPHLRSLGAMEISRERFLARITAQCYEDATATAWSLDMDLSHGPTSESIYGKTAFHE